MAVKEHNPMEKILIDKVVLNIGIGSNEDNYNNAKLLLEKLTSHKPIQSVSKKRLPEFKIRKGQVIGAMVTLRNKDAIDILKRAIDANDNVIKYSSISNNSLSFGVKEYIYFSGVKYDPKIGMLGLNLNGSFTRKGRRQKKISNEEISSYIEKEFGVTVNKE